MQIQILKSNDEKVLGSSSNPVNAPMITPAHRIAETVSSIEGIRFITEVSLPWRASRSTMPPGS